MQLPEYVKRALEERAAGIGTTALKRASDALSQAYRAGAPASLATPEQVTAYAAVRMPATFAAASTVLAHLKERLGGRAVASVLDVGAGSGAASLAAAEIFPGASITMLERNPALSAAAREWLPQATIVNADLTRIDTLPPADLVIAAYSLGEIRRQPLELLWNAARVALVVVEPGTPVGYSLVLGIRNELLKCGAHVAAPCRSDQACPLGANDWCHFAARVERSRLHRQLKGADLNYEDEKFSYVALTREPALAAGARIIRRPVQSPGLIQLETCTPSGLRSERVTKRDREKFRAARRAVWGSVW